MLNGVINFYKPPGMSSAQAVAFIKNLTRQKTGHAGTLDPEAAGVLPVLSGQATRICDYVMAGNKQYLAEIAFGTATDTQDAQGKVVKSGTNYPDIHAVKAIMPHFIGELMQMPPQFSALKIGGETAYKLAREGKVAELKPRQIRIDSINLMREMPDHGFLLQIECGKGSYIRALASDIGEALGCPAHLRFLLREKCGAYHMDGAVSPEQLKKWISHPTETERGWFTSIEDALKELPRYEIPHHLIKAATNGVALPMTDIIHQSVFLKDTEVCLYVSGKILGIYKLDGHVFRVAAMFPLYSD